MAKITIDDTLISRPIKGVDQYDQLVTYLNAINDNTTAVYTSADNTFTGDNTFSGESDLTGDFKINSVAVTSTAAELNILDGVTATAAEINKAADLSSQEQTITTAGAQVVTPAITALFLDNDTTAIAATIADASSHQGFFQISAISEPAAGQDHTVTLTSGAFNAAGNTIATFSDIGDSIFLYFNQSGIGNIIVNTGSVALS